MLKLLRLLAVLCFLGISAYPSYAVWEHAPITKDTRLPANHSDLWEFSLIYSPDAIYPVEFSCPAGSRAILHCLNRSQKTILLRFHNPEHVVNIAPGDYRRINLGVQTPGAHAFELEVPLENPIDMNHGHPEIPPCFKCVLKAGTWPDTGVVYRSAWILRQHELLPQNLRLPAGQICEVYVVGDQAACWQAAGFTFEAKPNAVTLTKIKRPKCICETVTGPSKAKLCIK